jgi:hypothetical protein
MSDLAAPLADRLAIQDVLCRYARGIDRCDEAVLRAVWWPGATADYGNGAGDAGDWSGAVVTALGAMRRTQHFLGNMLIEIDGDGATAETYCRAYHEIDGTGGPEEMEVGGRYLDRLEKRDGEWRIAQRRYVLDWNRNTPSTAAWDGPLYGGLQRRGARAPDDPSYTGA